MDQTVAESIFYKIFFYKFLKVLNPDDINSNEINYNRITLSFDNNDFQKKYDNFEKKYTISRKRVNLLIFLIGISDIVTNSIFLIDSNASESNIIFGLFLFLLFAFEVICVFELNTYSYIADIVVKLSVNEISLKFF